jgi:hypothetical protein
MRSTPLLCDVLTSRLKKSTVIMAPTREIMQQFGTEIMVTIQDPSAKINNVPITDSPPTYDQTDGFQTPKRAKASRLTPEFFRKETCNMKRNGYNQP